MYHSHSIGLSKHHRDVLARAVSNKSPVTLRLKKSNLSGNDVVHLTKTQINRISKAQASGKGSDLKLSYKQLSHGIKSGTGLLSLIGLGIGKKDGKGMFSKIVNGTKDIGKKLASTAVDKSIGVAGKLFENMLMDKLTGDKKKSGNGVKNLRSPGKPPVHGDGIFDDIASVGKKVANTGLNLVTNKGPGILGKVAEAMVMKKLMGKGVKKSKKKGDGLFDIVSKIKDVALPIATNVGMKVGEQMLMNKLLGKGVKKSKKGQGLLSNAISSGSKILGGLPMNLLNGAGNDVMRKLSGRGLINPGY